VKNAGENFNQFFLKHLCGYLKYKSLLLMLDAQCFTTMKVTLALKRSLTCDVM